MRTRSSMKYVCTARALVQVEYEVPCALNSGIARVDVKACSKTDHPYVYPEPFPSVTDGGVEYGTVSYH